MLGVLAAAAAGAAQGAIQVADDARKPTLRVDARGNAEVSWQDRSGGRRYLLIPRRGRVLPGGRLPGREVSKPTRAAKIPFRRALERTPDGAFYALQAWRVVKGGPVQLRFSRWRGEPTEVTAAAECCRNEGETLAGAASFQGRPLFGRSPTTAGTRVRIFVYVDCFRCGGARGWERLLGVPPRPPDGSYSLFVRPDWLADRYRLVLAGPNLGWSYTPDAVAFAATAQPAPVP